MGFAAPLLLFGGMLGLGYMASRNMMGNQMQGQQAALQGLQTANNTALDDLPEPPEAPEAGAAANSAAEEARKSQLAALAKAEQKNMTNPTGGQGVLGLPSTSKKQLLGF